MAHSARILAASISPDGVPLTSFEVVMPRIILAEFNTHRVLRTGEDVENSIDFGYPFSRNSASSRAIPVEKMLKAVMTDPYIPTSWGKNQKGMQAGAEVDAATAAQSEKAWLHARDAAVAQAQRLLDLGIHKQTTNRLLEPFMWHTVLVTATEWSNFFHLRNNPQAHPDIQVVAGMMQELYEHAREPRELQYGEWHLPLISEYDESEIQGPNRNVYGLGGPVTDEAAWLTLCKVSVGRCARVSYLTHDGKRDLQADIDLHDRLLESGHMSPFEHVVRPATLEDTDNGARFNMKDIEAARRWDGGEYETTFYVPPDKQWHGNFRGWVQYRKLIAHESDILAPREVLA